MCNDDKINAKKIIAIKDATMELQKESLKKGGQYKNSTINVTYVLRFISQQRHNRTQNNKRLWFLMKVIHHQVFHV